MIEMFIIVGLALTIEVIVSLTIDKRIEKIKKKEEEKYV